MKISSKISRAYRIISLTTILASPAIFFLPQQFYKNLFLSIPFWFVISIGIFTLPAAIKKIKNSHILPVILFMLYITATSITTIFSQDIFSSLPILYISISYMLIFFASAEVINSLKLKELFAGILLVSVTVLSIISLYNTLILKYISVDPEGLSFMWGYFGHNHLAVLLLIAIPLCLYFIYRKSKNYPVKIFLIFQLVFYLFSLLISYARGASLSLALIVLIGIGFLQLKLRDKIAKKSQLLLTIVVTVIFLIATSLFYAKFMTGIEARLFHWQKGIEIFIENLLLGSGPGTYHLVSNKASELRFSQAYYPHNIFIHHLSDSGLFGLISVMLLYGGIILHCIRTIMITSVNKEKLLNTAICFGILGILLNELVDFDLQLPTIGMLFWILVGIIFNTSTKRK